MATKVPTQLISSTIATTQIADDAVTLALACKAGVMHMNNAEAIAFIQGVEDDIAIERAKL